MLDVRRLRVLREVARRGSFSGAAEALGYTQPAVSRHVATLEAETGAVLVTRVARGARLTDAGQVLVRHADTVLAQLEEAEAELRAVVGLQGGQLRLATFSSAGATIVPLAIARFRDAYAEVDLHVEIAEGEDAFARLRAGEIDVALSNLAHGREDDGLAGRWLFDDPMYVALPRGHALADRPVVRLRQLAGEQWMLASTRTCPDAAMFRRACHAAGFEPRVAFENDDYNAILGFVAAGVGVALIPDLIARAAREDVVVRSLGRRAPVRRIFAVTRSGYRSPSVAAMLDVLADVGARWVAAGGVGESS